MTAVRVWTCRRVTGGRKCGAVNASRSRKCGACGKPRPARKRPAHMVALDLEYAAYVQLNGGDRCAICLHDRDPSARRLDRDHDHRTGKPRGLLCHLCNRALPNWVTTDWLMAAWHYMVRAQLLGEGRLQWVEEDRGHSSPCWIWQRAVSSSGYAVVRFEGSLLYVHRLMCSGPIPEGYEVDHLCRQRPCINPAHLEAVTGLENTQRAFRTAETCKRGHPWTEENTYIRPDGSGRRQCRACIRLRTKGIAA